MEFEEYLSAVQEATDEKVATLLAIADKKSAAMLAAAVTAQDETLAAVKLASEKIEIVNLKRIEFEKNKQDKYDKEVQKSLAEAAVESEAVKKSK